MLGWKSLKRVSFCSREGIRRHSTIGGCFQTDPSGGSSSVDCKDRGRCDEVWRQSGALNMIEPMEMKLSGLNCAVGPFTAIPEAFKAPESAENEEC
jgi:hypothetical protein